MATKSIGSKTTTKTAPRSKGIKAPIKSPAAAKKAGGANPAGGKTITAAKKTAAKTTATKRLSRPAQRERAAAIAAGAGGATGLRETAGTLTRKAAKGTAMGLATKKGAA